MNLGPGNFIQSLAKEFIIILGCISTALLFLTSEKPSKSNISTSKKLHRAFSDSFSLITFVLFNSSRKIHASFEKAVVKYKFFGTLVTTFLDSGNNMVPVKFVFLLAAQIIYSTNMIPMMLLPNSSRFLWSAFLLSADLKQLNLAFFSYTNAQNADSNYKSRRQSTPLNSEEYDQFSPFSDSIIYRSQTSKYDLAADLPEKGYENILGNIRYR